MFEDALPEKTKAVLRRLSSVIRNEGFYLAGGSGLALQIGHRISEDLDFFKESSFEPNILLSELGKGAERVEEIMVERGTLIIIHHLIRGQIRWDPEYEGNIPLILVDEHI